MSKLLHEFEETLLLEQGDSGITYGYTYMCERMAEHPEWKNMHWSFCVEETKSDRYIHSRIKISVEDPNAIDWATIMYALAAIVAIVLILYPWR